MKVCDTENKLFRESKTVRVSERAERLLQFLFEYKELWFENGRSVEAKIARITDDAEEQKRILALYEQAEEDYMALRPIRTRFFERRDGKYSTPAYKINEAQIDALRQAGIGRSFGLSDENQAEYDRLVSSGVDEEVVQFIFKKFSNYQRFKELFCEFLELGKVSDLFRKCYRANSLFVSDIDLSKSNGIRETDREYVELLRDILGVKYIVFDGTRIVEKLNDFINQKDDKSRKLLTENEKEIICKIYGIGTKRISSEEIRKQMGISNSRVRQILKTGLNKLSSRKSQLIDVVYLSDEYEVIDFLVNYFKKNDVFRPSKSADEQEILNQPKKFVEIQDVGLSNDMYSITFAKKLKSQIEDLEKDRAVISAWLKMQFDAMLDNFDEVKIKDFYLGRTLIDRFNLSVRTRTSLSKKGICTIGDAIDYSRKCKTSMKKKIKNMGDKSFDEFKTLINSLGLTLEDEDKSEKTRIHNDRILSHLSKKDAAKFFLFLEQIRYSANSSVMQIPSIEEINTRINSIKEAHGIRISNEELIQNIESRIDKLDYRFDYDSNMSELDLPDEVARVFKIHGINKILDIYRLRDRDINYLKKRFKSYFDMVVFELNRIGFEFPLVGEVPNNMMKYATYLNKRNIELIMFFIEESNMGIDEKNALKEELFDKIKKIEKKDIHDVNAELAAKIKELKSRYQILDEKKEEFSTIEVEHEFENPDNQDFGDIG